MEFKEYIARDFSRASIEPEVEYVNKPDDTKELLRKIKKEEGETGLCMLRYNRQCKNKKVSHRKQIARQHSCHTIFG